MKNKSVCEGKKLKQFPLCKAPGSDNKRRRRCWRENRLTHKAKKLHSFSTSNLSVHLMPSKAASRGGGGRTTQSQGRCLPTAWPLLSLGSVKLHHSHPEGRPPSQRGSTHGSLSACAVQTLLGHSLDLGDGKSS